jgi:predicted AAA+ superfamily ATPase
MKDRKAIQDLREWRNSDNRKPLVIRGARQVGKSTLVRMFGEEFDHFIELNAEKPDIQQLFRDHQDLAIFLQALYLQKNLTAPEGALLLFIDEIQESPEAIRLLRYFYEEAPEIYVITAGSLLDFSLGEVRSFPVGRVSYYFLHPLNFEEFLDWKGEAAALDALRSIPAPQFAHTRLKALFHEYTLVGGMPEVVLRFVEEGSFSNLKRVYDDLWQAYLDDIEKYATNNTQRQILRHIIRTAPHEQDRITFAGFGKSDYRSREVGEAMRNLELARILQLIYPTTHTRPPLAHDLKKHPRLQFIDTGLLNHSLQIQSQFLGLKDLHHLYRGFVLQHILTQELIALHTGADFKPQFWVRQKSNASAEVDLVYNFKGIAIPIEIKAGKQGRLRSLHQFVERAPHKLALRFLQNTYSEENPKTPGGTTYRLINLPYYAMSQLRGYLEMVIDQSF